jgi:hypothetical protein
MHCYVNETTQSGSDPSKCGGDREWKCIYGNCLSLGDAISQDWGRVDFFPYRIRSPAGLQLGFRLTDDLGSTISTLRAEDIVVKEGENRLLPMETRQQLTRIEGQQNFIQLMISMCPRTSLGIDYLIDGLNTFMENLDPSNSYVSLSVFDGGWGYVTLVPFTRDWAYLLRSFDKLRDYVQRDDGCNVKESVIDILQSVATHIFGQPWDRKHMVVFSASGDLLNYASDERTDRALIANGGVSMFMIGWNIPQVQEILFTRIGRSRYYNSANASDIPQHFQLVAQSISVTLDSDYVFAYCSPSRVGLIDATLYWSLPETEIQLQKLQYDASKFRAGCNSTALLDICSPCPTTIAQGQVICHKCFNASSVPVGSHLKTTTTLLRVPDEPDRILSLPFKYKRDKFNVYIRQGGISNPMFYDEKYEGVTMADEISMQRFPPGTLVGIYVEFNGSYDDDHRFIAIGRAAPPVTPPDQQATPVSPPVLQNIPIATPLQPIRVPVSQTPESASEGERFTSHVLISVIAIAISL